MKKQLLLCALLLPAICLGAAESYGILFGEELEVNADNASDIFGDGKAAYNPANNVLTLQDGFSYHLSKGLLSIQTGKPLTIRLYSACGICLL